MSTGLPSTSLTIASPMVLTRSGDGVGVDVGVELRRDENTRRQERVGLRDGRSDVTRGDATRLSCTPEFDDQVDLSLPAAVERGAGYAGMPSSRGSMLLRA